jgi:hypothetical protein
LNESGMVSKAVLARFEQELALMDHPNTARVLDGRVGLSSMQRTSTFRDGSAKPSLARLLAWHGYLDLAGRA